MSQALLVGGLPGLGHGLIEFAVLVVRPRGGTAARCIAVTSRLALWLVGAVLVPLAPARVPWALVLAQQLW